MRASVLIMLGALAVGCGNDGLESDPDLQPPEDTDRYDPSDGQGEGGGYYSTSGQSGGGGADETGDTGQGIDCEEENRKCAHTFELADDGYQSVDVMGSFSPEGWEDGVPMLLDGDTWRATIPLPWGGDTEYRFRIDGSADWVLDPTNDATANDNSLLGATMCELYTCEPTQIGDFDWRDAVIYFVFVDRFLNGDPTNDGGVGVPSETEWQGGDWAGVTQKIEEGYFEDLGVNVLWLSVPMDNTDAVGLGTDGRDYSAYHAYWPTDLNATEEHFGTMAELQQLIDTAHEHDLKVLFDYAMNHVHADAPVYAENPQWFWPNDNGAGGDCVCGSGCGWDGADGRRCWFTDYLPDFDFTNDAARDFSVSNALQWIADTGVDGFRLDAVKHIEDAWLLDLRERVTAEVEPETGEHFYMVGETFTGNVDTIAYYVNADMLDGQFDFPLRMEMARTVLMRQGSMSDLASFLDANDGRYGAGIMSTFIGNHDIPRCIHLAEDAPLWDDPWAGGKDRAWENKPGTPTARSAFERLGNAFTILMTTPGAPLVYYGDEIGLGGAGDPDNRRFMQWDGYSDGQTFLFDHIAALTQLRADHPATRRGVRATLASTADTLTYSMTFGGDEVFVVINRADGSAAAGGLPDVTLTDELTGATVQGPSVDVPPRSAMVLVR
ncbi:MAG: alpha-amylase family glycosyl hydrolase [Myxococcota bacterium]